MAIKNIVQDTLPHKDKLVIAIILWVVGLLATVLDVITLSNNLGVWALVVAELLLILDSLIDKYLIRGRGYRLNNADSSLS
ncbi:MAG: hypothetical protein SVR81_09880 [Chloroflexota bacterium]|nr:hypothetical protein [Chloroflexota bacterium]